MSTRVWCFAERTARSGKVAYIATHGRGPEPVEPDDETDLDLAYEGKDEEAVAVQAATDGNLPGFGGYRARRVWEYLTGNAWEGE